MLELIVTNKFKKDLKQIQERPETHPETGKRSGPVAGCAADTLGIDCLSAKGDDYGWKSKVK